MRREKSLVLKNRRKPSYVTKSAVLFTQCHELVRQSLHIRSPHGGQNVGCDGLVGKTLKFVFPKATDLNS